nr:hypothetical protein GCM10020185_22030 [Pseudomonas brassicacearum subsp. brassicacearum]
MKVVFHIKTTTVQHAERRVVEGGVVATVGVSELFAAIEQQDFFSWGISSGSTAWAGKGRRMERLKMMAAE